MSRYEDWPDEEDRMPRPPSPFRVSALMQTVRKRRNLIVLSSAIFTVLVVVLFSLVVKDSYEATAVILPPKQDQSVSTLLSGPGGNLSSFGALGALGLKNPNDVYTSLLFSRTLNTSMVNQFDLKPYYHTRTMQETIMALQRHTWINLGKDNLIRVSVRSHDPVLSSKLANGFIDQLHDMNTNMALTEAVQRRLFYEQQLDQEKVLLAKAETDLQETQIKTGVLLPGGQADMAGRSISALRMQISGREAELQSLKAFDAPDNPDYVQLQAQISSLQSQLARLENSTKVQTPGDIEVPSAQLPKSSLEFTRKYREVQQHEQVYTLLLKQFEAAKIDESKTAPVIEVVDRAVPAESPLGPSRLYVGFCAFLFALLLNLIWCVVVYMFGVVNAQKKEMHSHS